MSQKITVMKIPGLRTRHRKHLTLKQKLEILRRNEAGARAADISRCMNLASSTVRTILKNSDRIKEYGRTTMAMESKCLFKNRSPIMVDMERLLLTWISDQFQKGHPLHTPDIQEMARTIYEDLKQEYGENSNLIEPFKASAGWFERFKKRANITATIVRSNLDNSGEIMDETVDFLMAGDSEGGRRADDSLINEEMEAKSIAGDIVDAVELIGEALFFLHECDPDKGRSTSVCKAVSRVLDCYSQYFKEVSSSSLGEQQQSHVMLVASNPKRGRGPTYLTKAAK